MYRVEVLHNNTYKLIEVLNFELPEVQYYMIDNMIITRDIRIIELAKEAFQFQPELLHITYSASEPLIDQGWQIAEEDWAKQNVFVM